MRNRFFRWARQEMMLFCNALVFYTRLPAPCREGYSARNLGIATRYFPLIGWIVGGGVAGVTWGAAALWPTSVAVLLGMAAGVWLTGAFHEDGFADSCDGLGGGYDKARKLAIMKDSRVGTYGVVGLGLLFGIKFAALTALPLATLPWVLWAGHALSRLAAVYVIYFLAYAREDAADGKAKPVAQGVSVTGLLVATGFGMMPLGWLPLSEGLLGLAMVVAVTLVMARILYLHLGGYTGDGLGAVQQAGEVGFYLGVLMGISAP